jgi:hypothetical protein
MEAPGHLLERWLVFPRAGSRNGYVNEVQKGGEVNSFVSLNGMHEPGLRTTIASHFSRLILVPSGINCTEIWSLFRLLMDRNTNNRGLVVLCLLVLRFLKLDEEPS